MRSAPTSAGVVGEDGQAGLDAGLDEEGLEVEVELADLAQDGIERRDDRGDDDAGDDGHLEVVEGEEVLEDDAALGGGLVDGRGDAPVGDELRRLRLGGEVVEAEDRVGVADVDGEEHGFP